MKPLEWLLSSLDMVNVNNKSQPFKVISASTDTIRVLHRDTGAVWEFKATTVREAAS